MPMLFLRGFWPKKTLKTGIKRVFVSYCPKSSPKPLSESKIRISIQFRIPVPYLSLIGREIKKLLENLIFNGTSGLKSVLKLQMTSYSVLMTSLIFCFFEKFLAYTLFLPSFIVVRHQMVELNWGAFLPPLSITGVSRTLSKIGLTLPGPGFQKLALTGGGAPPS